MDVSRLVIDNEDGSCTLSWKNILDIAVSRVYVWVELKEWDEKKSQFLLILSVNLYFVVCKTVCAHPAHQHRIRSSVLLNDEKLIPDPTSFGPVENLPFLPTPLSVSVQGQVT